MRKFVATIYNPSRNGFSYGYIKISFEDGEVVTRSNVEAKVISKTKETNFWLIAWSPVDEF